MFVVCGEGFGHASRCIHLGHYLEQHGHSVSYLAYGKSYDFFRDHGCINMYRGAREVCIDGENGFFSLKKTLICSKWVVFNLIRSGLRVRRMIIEHRIDCVICDTMYAGVITSRFRRVPVIFITNQNRFSGPEGKKNIVWRILNLVVGRYLHLAHAVIVPDYAPPQTVSEYNLLIREGERQRYHFTGPLCDVDLSRYQNRQKSIFVSFGGEPYKLPLYRMLKTIADERKDLVFDVFFSGAALPESSDNYITHGYVPHLHEYLAGARIAIVHGGLTTLHEALLFNKPVLIVMDPNHTEQQNNAKKIVDIGAGTAVDGRTLTKEILEKKIEETLALTPSPFGQEHATINGRKNAREVIESVAIRAGKRKIKSLIFPTSEQ